MCGEKQAYRKVNGKREEYWSKEIAFDCPITGKRHTINDCFTKCQENSYTCAEDGRRAMMFLYCLLDPQERYLHDGKARRNP